MPELIPARLSLDESGTPYATDFADCYFSRQDGLAESRYVFLHGNRLPERWQGRPQFTIAETGFGTGLNFLATWQAWQADPQRCGRLHFISIEKHPILKDTLRGLLVAWPELAPLAEELLAQYPPLLAGFHRLRLAGGRITLTLCFMDVLEALPEIVAHVDAWYLDGFAPARNPTMWQLPVLQGIAGLCNADATLATFTAAGEVRRNLQAIGFVVEKRPGFGTKREMLIAKASAELMSQQGIPSWFALPEPVGNRHARIIGGGIAGCQIARSLAERGWQVTLLEQHGRLATEASGNRAGVLIPKMTAQPGWGESFYQQAFLYALRQIRMLEQSGHEIEWAQCGALQLAHEPREAARQQAIHERGLPDDFVQIVDAETASLLAGIPLLVGASYFPQAGWLYPVSLCRALADHANIEIRCLEKAEPSQNEGVTVLASGNMADQYTQSAFLPFLPVMGQTSRGKASAFTAGLRTTLGHEGYLTPAVAGEHIFGATFVRHVREAQLSEAANGINFQQLQQYLPEFAASLSQVASGHAAIRMTTPDRYPVVGALPDDGLFRQAYADLRHGRTRQAYPPAMYQSGMFISAGYGSRGLATSGLCAEMLAALMDGEPLPLQASLYGNLHPGRFLIRQLAKGL